MRQYATKMALATIILAAGLITGAAAQTIKIGVTQPLTGAFAASGNYVAQGAKIAADEIKQSRRRARQEDRAGRSRTTSPIRRRPRRPPRS